jgi:hypothetical protein
MNIRTERRVVRPFRGIEAFDGLLRGVSLSLNDRELRIDKDYLDEAIFQDLKVSFEIALNLSEILLAAKEIDLEDHDIQLVVIAYGNTYKKSEILRNWNLMHDEIETSFTFHTEDLPDIIGDSFGGFNIVCALVLSNNKAPEPLRVYQAGTWLEKREIQVRPEKDVSFFSPTPMNALQKKELDLPGKTLLYVQEGEESILYASSVEEVITVWVDEETLLSLQTNYNASADIVAMLLARTAIGSIVELIRRVLNDSDFNLELYAESLQSKDVDERVLTKFVQKAQKVLGNGDDWLSTLQALKVDPQLVASKIEASADLKGEIKRALTKEGN